MKSKTIVKTWNVPDWQRGFYEKGIFAEGYTISSETDIVESHTSGCNTCVLWFFLIPIFLLAWPIGLLIAILAMVSGGRVTQKKVKVVYRLLP